MYFIGKEKTYGCKVYKTDPVESYNQREMQLYKEPLPTPSGGAVPLMIIVIP